MCCAGCAWCCLQVQPTSITIQAVMVCSTCSDVHDSAAPVHHPTARDALSRRLGYGLPNTGCFGPVLYQAERMPLALLTLATRRILPQYHCFGMPAAGSPIPLLLFLRVCSTCLTETVAGANKSDGVMQKYDAAFLLAAMFLSLHVAQADHWPMVVI